MNPKISTFFVKVLSRLIKVNPAPLIEGAGARKRIANHCKINSWNKVVIITAKKLVENGRAVELASFLQKEKLEVEIFDGVNKEPTFSLAQKAKLFVLEANADAVIALGGGSVLDLSKLVCASVREPKKDLHKFAGILKINKPILPLIALPTTAGTGSETTFIAVISNDEGQKKTIISPKIVPNIAILDGELLTTLPSQVTAGSGIDALSHAVESYLTTCDKPSHDIYAKEAVELIYENLENSYNDPQNVLFRNKMLRASYLAGVSMNNEMVGYAHAFAHQIGAFYGVPHGEAIAMVLVRVLNHQKNKTIKKLSNLCEYAKLDCEGLTEEQKATLFIEKTAELIKKLGLKQHCDKLVAGDMAKIVENAFKETAVRYPVARFMTKAEAFEFLQDLSEGDE